MKSHPIEPFRIKSVEAIRLLPREEREKRLAEGGFNLFNIRAEDVFIDLLTDSGTGAMSERQWRGVFSGDESYAGSVSYYHLESVVREITGYPFIVPTHQGRAAEHLLFSTILSKGDYVVANTHFDTTRANVMHNGGIPIDLPHPTCADVGNEYPFKGDIDLDRLETFLKDNPGKVRLVLLTITNNSVGGQPLSMANAKAAADLAARHGVPLFYDAARFAENAWFLSQRESSLAGRSIKQIARAMFDLGAGCLMSAKKDGLSNIGGFLAVRDENLAAQVKELMVIIEGFPTYGGLAGRDLEAIAWGLEEVNSPDYLQYRVGQVEWLGERLAAEGASVVRPIGGHAVFIDAGAMYPHIPPDAFPAQTLAVGFYREGGIRTVEIGTLMFGGEDPQTHHPLHAPHELVRLAIPRRVYTASHLEHVAQTFAGLYKSRDTARGFAIEYQSPYLRHFTARLRELPATKPAGQKSVPAGR